MSDRPESSSRTRSRLVGLAATLAAACWAAFALARSTGMTGVAQSSTGCACHSTTPNANGPVTVTITGPQVVAPNSTSNYTLSVSGGPATTFGGFNLKASGGTLVAGSNSQLLNGELTHFNRNSRSWTFAWQAPAADGTVNFFAVSQAVNGNGGNSGDSWNWYGGAANTPFAITVNSLVGVDGQAAASLSLAPARPNPFASSTAIEFALARAGYARLDVLDLGGRRVKTLLAGELPAGRHLASWDGRDLRGGPAPSGLYVVRLTAAGTTLSTKVTRVSR